MSESKNIVRRHWSEEDMRQLIRDELVSPFVTAHVAEVAKVQVYEARRLWDGEAPNKAPPRSGWWRRLLGG